VLLAIQEASGDAMRELRATLEVLRDPDGPDGSERDAPAGVLDRLDGLVERARSTGLPAPVTISGTRRELPAEVDRAAYRIVQEALTNVSRHAGGAAAAVRIDYAGRGAGRAGRRRRQGRPGRAARARHGSARDDNGAL
jgi:signal transduction histidine kinase